MTISSAEKLVQRDNAETSWNRKDTQTDNNTADSILFQPL